MIEIWMKSEGEENKELVESKAKSVRKSETNP